jgi:predicted transposase/invertase (TIGR01784 family)
MAGIHDTTYKKLFYNPTLVRELLESFVHEAFVKDLDFSTLQRLDKSFITEAYESKEADILYKITFKGKPVYIFLLIEFQSTVEWFMALRFLRYTCEFYEFLIQKKSLKKLPAVFPILLYNGDRRWTAPVNIKELIEECIPLNYIPQFEYYKIIENEIPKEVLLQIQNVVSAIFYVENSSPVEVKAEMSKLVELLKKENTGVLKLFSNWINNFFRIKGESGGEEVSREINNLMEVRTMFETKVKEYGDMLMKQGIEQGELIDKQNVLIKQLSKKFGLSDEEKEYIKSITNPSKLDAALDEFVFSETKAQVLESLE